jgi:hypothetical protein
MISDLLLTAGAACAAGSTILITISTIDWYKKRQQKINADTDTMAALHVEGMRPHDDDEPFTQPIVAVVTDMPVTDYPEGPHTAILHPDPIAPEWPVDIIRDTTPISLVRPASEGARIWSDQDTNDWIQQMQEEMNRFLADLIGKDEFALIQGEMKKAITA